MAAPDYKLSYFNLTALAEPIRFLFCYGNIEFEDSRFEREEWPPLKPKMPMGQAPILEHKGKVAHQSVAISRYVAKLVKLVGKDEWEDLEIDAVVDTITDLRLKIGNYYYETDAKIKATKGEELFKDILPYYLGKLDAQVKNNNGYLVLGRLTWADIFFVAYLDYFNVMVDKELIENSPNLVALKDKVLALPAIKKWIETRPKKIY